MNIDILIIVLLAAVALITLIKRFSRNRYGNLRPSMEATGAYLSFRVDPSMSYYLSGSDLYPNAIIGVDPFWTLQSDLWRHQEMDSKRLKECVENMTMQGLGSGARPYGFEMFDDRGNRIGNWFSLPGQNVTIWIKGENRFELSTPDNLYSQR